MDVASATWIPLTNGDLSKDAEECDNAPLTFDSSIAQICTHSDSSAPLSVGRGIGAGLLARALTVLPRPVRLYTFQMNHGARRFYERHGFVPVGFGDGSQNEEGCPDVLYELA